MNHQRMIIFKFRMMIAFRIFRESILFALTALVVNKLRTILSLLGITIGILAIISVFTIVDSLENKIRSSVDALGENVIFVQKWPWTFGPDYPWWKYMNRPVPQPEELEQLQKNCRRAEAAAFVFTTRRTIKHQSSSIENVRIVGVSHDYYRVRDFEIAEGRYFSDTESATGKHLCIIGDEVARAFFPNSSPLGKSMKISGVKVFVVGVFKREGESLIGENIDVQVLVPLKLVQKYANTKQGDPHILVKGKEGVSNEELIDELTGLMRSIRKLRPKSDDNFALNETSMISNQVEGLFSVIGMAGWVIGGFSILVGGFGIANIMFVSVKERTNIIGIQKALGAKNYFILMQFLTESVVLCLIGGGIGLLIVYSITMMIGDSFGFEVTLSGANISLGFTISILIGVISGFIPAYTASQLDPVEAMRAK